MFTEDISLNVFGFNQIKIKVIVVIPKFTLNLDSTRGTNYSHYRCYVNNLNTNLASYYSSSQGIALIDIPKFYAPINVNGCNKIPSGGGFYYLYITNVPTKVDEITISSYGSNGNRVNGKFRKLATNNTYYFDFWLAFEQCDYGFSVYAKIKGTYIKLL